MRSTLLHEIMSHGRLVHIKKGQVFSSTDEDQDLMLVFKGYIKRYSIGADGSLGIQIIYGPHDFFSLTKLFRNLMDQSIYDGPETFYYEAMSESWLYRLGAEYIAQHASAQPLLYKDLLSEAGHHLKACVHSIESISLRTIYARVAHLLLYMLKEYGEQTPEGVRLRAPLTHQDIADILGVTRASVTIAIVKLRQNGVITSTRHIMAPTLGPLLREAYN